MSDQAPTSTSGDEYVPPYLRLINDVHESYIKFKKNRVHIHRKPDVPNLKFAVIYGLACHTDMLACEVLPLLDTDDPRPRLAAVPIVRSIYEAGLTAQWVSRVPGAEYRIAKKHHDVARQQTEELKKSGLALLREAADIRAKRDDDEEPAAYPDMPSSASIQSICETFEGGTDLYLIYRMLCGNTHAGVETIDEWLSLDDGVTSGYRVRADPKNHWDQLTDAVALWGVVWAAFAFDDLVKNTPRRSFLNKVARVGMVVPRLPKVKQ